MSSLLHHLRELWAERGRVGLVVMGVVWGTLSLTLLLAFGAEMVETTTGTAGNFGTHLLRLGSGARTVPYRGLPAGQWIHRYPEDADAILAGVPGIDAVAVEYMAGSGNPLEWGEQRMNVPVVGCTPSFGDLRNQRPSPGGRFLNQRDELEQRRVIFLGTRTAERLFGTHEAVGERVELWNVTFTVVGVLRPTTTTTSYSGEDRDKVCIPSSVFRGLYGRRTANIVWARFTDVGDSPTDREGVIDAVFEILAKRHGIHPDDRGAVYLMDYVEIEEMVDGILAGLRIFTVGVGLIGLLVALVGVANVSYVMVEERTAEIGVMMALGASPTSVLRARLFESVVVTVTGGVIGVAATAAILALLNLIELGPDVRAYLGHPTISLPLGAVIVALLVAGGVLAGWFPARRAAVMNPVEALREN